MLNLAAINTLTYVLSKYSVSFCDFLLPKKHTIKKALPFIEKNRQYSLSLVMADLDVKSLFTNTLFLNLT